jgi:hypothetical protein
MQPRNMQRKIRISSLAAVRRMRCLHRIAAAVIVLFAGTAVFGSTPDPCSLTSTVPDAKVTVGISNGQTSFREGEVIPLVLSFTSTAAKRYWADNRNYDRSGRLNIETYCVEPAARDPLADYFKTGIFMGGGLGSTQQLSEKPVYRYRRAERVEAARAWTLPPLCCELSSVATARSQ